ncbi:MAG TPA: WYL domain-containing protein [Verrucomicrobiae bacterium]|jgi:predicted DNA-binding transcriptional regulator YafY|nr:WYL domain-containing protein [Verrucomicrobiae bacterium]
MDRWDSGADAVGRKRDRLARFYRVTTYLESHPEGATPDQIAAFVGMSRRNAYRDLRALQEELDIPLWAERGRWGISDRAFLPAFRLTRAEAMAVFLAARLMARYADAYDPDLAAAFQKLGEALPPVLARHVQRTLDVMAARPLDPVGSRNLHLLTQAWAERRVVELTYDPSTYDPTRQPREARVRPYLIEPSADSHALYLIGFDETKGGLRTFKLERIRSLAISPVAFEPPPDGEIEAALDRAWGIVADQPVVEVVLRFAPSVASRVAETTWHPTQAVVRNADGSLTWRARVSGTLEIRPWILGWGADVEVLEPEALRAEIGGIVHAAAARYPRG